MGKLNINNGGIDTNKVMPDIDERFGPYASIEAANTALGASGRDCITAGLTVGITQGDGSVKEYWYQPQGSGLALVPKQRLSGTPVEGDFASFDANGNIVDSGHKHSDYATASQGEKADTAYQKPSGGIPATDLASAAQTSLGKADTAVQEVKVGTTTTGAAGTNASVRNSGTDTHPVLDFTIPKGADGQDGADAVNPFKGWWPDLATLKAAITATPGDSAYVKDASPATTWSIYVYDETASSENYWADSGTDADTSNVQTFASSQKVNQVHLVNDFVTGGENDVATAETVKTIADTTMQLVESDNILDPSTITVGKFVRKDNGVADSLSLSASQQSLCYGVTGYIDLTSAGLICNHVSGTNGTYLVAGCIYDSNKTFVTHFTTTGGNYKAIDPTGHDNWKYVRFNVAAQSYLAPNENYAVYRQLTLPSSYIPYFTPYWLQKPQEFNTEEKVNEVKLVNDLITGGAHNVLTAEQGKILNDKLYKKVIASKNILNPATIKSGYVRKDNGAFYSNSDHRCSDFIEKGSGIFALNRVWYISGNYGCAGVLYNENKEMIGYLAAGNTTTSWIFDLNNYSFSSSIKYVRFNFGLASATQEGGPLYGQNFAIYRLGYLPSYEEYSEITETVFAEKQVKLSDLEFEDIRFGKNRCDPAKITLHTTSGESIDLNTGRHSNAIWQSLPRFTDYIPVQKNDLYCNVGYYHTVSTYKTGWCAYDKDYKFTHGCPSSGYAKQYTYQEGDEYVIFVLESTGDVQVEIGHAATTFEEYSANYCISPDVLPASTISDEDYDNIKSKLASDKILPSSLDVVLPAKFYAVVGDTLQLFFKNMVRAVNPLNYWTKATCYKGKQYHRYFQYRPVSGEAANYSFDLSVYDDNLTKIGGGTSVIQVGNSPTSPSVMKKILAIGSSTTAGGQWVCEAQRRLLASNGTPQGMGLNNISFVGSISVTKYGQTAKLEGHSGWSWVDFTTEGRAGKAFRFYLSGTGNNVSIGNVYTNNSHSYTVTELNTIDGVETILCDTSSASNTPSASGTLTLSSGDGDPTLTFTSAVQESGNPFWNTTSQKLDFTTYVNTNCGGSIDMVYIMLGENALFTLSADEQKAYAETFITTLHTEYPNCKVVLVGGSLPSMVNMMPGYGAGSQYANVYRVFARLMAVYAKYKELAEEYSEYVEFEFWGAQMDSDYNMPLTMKNVNTRNSSVQEPYANNTIHPGEAGYMQFADACYRSVVNHLCQ